MSPSTWSARQLGTFWLGALGLSVLLLALGRLHRPPRPVKFFWLIPYPVGIRGLGRFLAGLGQVALGAFRLYPFETTALLAIPAVAIGCSVAWGVARLWRH